MSISSNTSDNLKPSICPICCEPINPAAKRCNACQTRLDRPDLLERFQWASPVLAILTALISVVTIGLPSLVQSLTPNGSNTHVAFVRSGSDYPAPYTFDYQIYVSNSGNRPAALGRVWVSQIGTEAGDKIELEIPEHYWPKDAEQIRRLEILAPGESRSIYYSRRNPKLELPGKARITVNMVEFNGTPKQRQLEVP